MDKINGHRPGYKPTALGWIPDDWEVLKLDKAIKLINGKAFKPEEWQKEGLPIIRIQNLNDQNADFNFYDQPVEEKYYVKDGDILFAWSGTKGVSFGARIWDRDLALLNQHIFKVIPKEDVLSKEYSYLVLKNVQDSIEAKAHGFKSSFVHVKKFDLDKTLLPIPPLAEQENIWNVIKTWNSAINNTEQLINLHQQRKKALMQQLLAGKKRLPGFGGEWKEVRLSDLFERVTRKNEAGNTNVVTISAQSGFVRQEDFFNKIVASEVLDNYFLVHKGEFCYNKSYSNGYPWGATKRLKDFDMAVVTTLYICFGLKDHNHHSEEFFEHFFEAGSLDKGLTKIAHEGGRAHGLLNVTPSDFFSLKITIPEFDEQVAIANVLQAADKEIQLLLQKLEGLKEQKKGLMQQLLTGKTRVKV